MNLHSQPAPLHSADAAGEPGAMPRPVAGQGAPVTAAPSPVALRSKNLGLLCDDPALPEALLAYRAAADLGAHVSLVRPRFTGAQEVHAIPETARMLGRLYDVLACVALPQALILALRAEAGVPVVGDLDIGAAAAGPCTDAMAIGADDRLRQWQRALAASLG